MSYLNKEVGGDHYKKCKMQPYKYITEADLSFTQGNIAKYITRCWDKNGIQDIEKCVHYARLGKEFGNVHKTSVLLADRYCKTNGIDAERTAIILANASGDYDRVIMLCERIIRMNNKNTAQ